MKRRSFLSWVGAGWVASSLPIAIAACQAPKTEEKTTPAVSQNTPAVPQNRTDGFQAIALVAELEENGLVKGKIAGSKVVVTRANENNLFAVEPLCTHQACTVQWEGEKREFACGCHGSRFSADGKVTKGPATEPLTSYAVKIEGDTVLVKVS